MKSNLERHPLTVVRLWQRASADRPQSLGMSCRILTTDRLALFFRAFLLLAIVLISGACERVKVFEPEGEEPTNNESTVEILNVNITGGFAGVNQELRIYADGQAVLENALTYREKRTILAEQEVKEIIRRFAENDFFHLESSYGERDVVDAFYYEISFSNGYNSHRVVTNGFDIPENLKRLLDEINRLVDRVLNDGIELELKLDRDRMAVGDTLNITFSIRNTTDHPIELTFPSSQIADIIIARDYEMTQENIVWNWAHDFAFLTVITQHTLMPNEPYAITVSWDGKDNDGTPVHGTFYVSGVLESFRGGQTKPVPIVVE